MKLLTAKETEYGYSCKEIGLEYYNKTSFAYSEEDDILAELLCNTEILGLNASAFPINFFEHDGVELAINGEVNYEYTYNLLIACLRKKAEEFEFIRRSKKKVIVICGDDFNFIDDVEQYIAVGAVVMVTNKLRKKNGQCIF